MFQTIEAANRAARILGVIFVFGLALLYHCHETEKWPFNQQKLARELSLTQHQLQSATLTAAELQQANRSLSNRLQRMLIERRLTDSLDHFRLDHALMAQELAMVKSHSAEIISLTKSHKDELVRELKAENAKKHEVTKDLIGVAKEYGANSGICCGQKKKEEPKISRFFFRFEAPVDTSATLRQ